MAVLEPDLSVLPESGLLIGEDHVADSSGGEFQHKYAATGKPTVAVALAGAHEIDLAVTAARRALTQWRATPVDQRREALLRYAQLLRQHADELIAISQIDNGFRTSRPHSGPARPRTRSPTTLAGRTRSVAM